MSETLDPDDALEEAAGKAAGAASAATPAGHRRIMVVDVAGPTLVLAAFIGFWYWLSYDGMSENRQFLVPPLHEVIRDGYLDWTNFSLMLEALWLSTQVALWGLGIAIVLGMAVAIVMSQARWIERSVFPHRGGAPEHPDPRPRTPHRHRVRLQIQRPGDRVHHHRDLPDHQQHALRDPVGGSGAP